MDNRKKKILEELETYGVLVGRPETRSIEELEAAVSVFREDKEKSK